MKSGKSIDELGQKNGRPKSSDALQASISARLRFEDEEATRKRARNAAQQRGRGLGGSQFPGHDAAGTGRLGRAAMADLKLQPVKEGDAIIIALPDNRCTTAREQPRQFPASGRLGRGRR